MARILIIEDERAIQRMIEYDLIQLGYDVDSSLDGTEGYHKAKNDKFDVILLDLMLPGMNGLDICRKLREDGINSFIIMLTAIDDEYNKVQGFSVGADDYVTKPFSPRELSARIKAGLRRIRSAKETSELEYKGIKVSKEKHEVFVNDTKVELTLKEFELLVYLLERRGKALSRDELLQNLWGFKYDGDSRVVDVHIFKLREKVDPELEIIKSVRGIGYKII